MSTIPDNTIAGITDITSVSQATLHTSKGDITVAFFSEEAPLTVKNFITLANRGFYDGTRFHRVIKEFMIQGGDPLSKDDALAARWGTGGPGYAFADEINNKKLVKGALAMANAGPNTNGSQFFIVTADETPWLDGKHTVFGNVVAGMDVVMAIEGVSTGASDRPLVPVTIESITLK
ncbi:MAG: peptidylprolyl isomerase [Candidatus Yonathbacteria bacterium]|nr:peptidylprolyl isomerase [Candidatus Yonathbacteria bacterium]